MRYVIDKLEEDTLDVRATLYEDLSEFMPDEAIARDLRLQAEQLRKLEARMQLLKLSLHKHQS